MTREQPCVLSFEGVAFGVRAPPLLTFRKGFLPIKGTERDVKSVYLCGKATFAICKTENGFE